jgi:hypothetical protein
VQARCGAVAARGQVPDHLTAGHEVTDLDGRYHRLEIDPPAGPHDRHQRSTRQPAGVGDDTRDWRHDRRTHGGSKIDPAVARPVRLGGDREGAHHPGRAGRPAPDEAGGPLGRGGHGQEGAREAQNQCWHPEGE